MLVTTSDDLQEWLAREVQDNVVTKLMEYTYRQVVKLSPVDTGQFRASWNMTKNTPNFATISDGTGLPPPDLPKLTFSKGEYPVIFISNGKHYGPYLEDGWSKQAPNGMIKVAMASAKVLGRFL